MHWSVRPPLDEQRWHTDGPADRLIVAENDEPIGMMDTSHLAERVVKDHNYAIERYTGYPALTA